MLFWQVEESIILLKTTCPNHHFIKSFCEQGTQTSSKQPSSCVVTANGSGPSPTNDHSGISTIVTAAANCNSAPATTIANTKADTSSGNKCPKIFKCFREHKQWHYKFKRRRYKDYFWQMFFCLSAHCYIYGRLYRFSIPHINISNSGHILQSVLYQSQIWDQRISPTTELTPQPPPPPVCRPDQRDFRRHHQPRP